MSTYEQRLARLHADLVLLEHVAVAYSGGVDSGVLLHAARAALGERALAVIADSPSLARRELEAALAFARAIGVEPCVLATGELDDPRYRRNQGDRCYFCKHELFERMRAWARERGLTHLAFGEITDDLVDDRPGRRAAQELSVLAPLAAAGLTKDDVRRYAREHELSIAEKPASACLASRIPVGSEVTRERLLRVERAEAHLFELGLRQLRVRDHGRRARVEVGAGELALARGLLTEIATRLAPLGFAEVELDAYQSPQEKSVGRSVGLDERERDSRSRHAATAAAERALGNRAAHAED